MELNQEQTVKALDILEKMNFFQGQRAGRELWFDKPIEIQEQDIASFSQGVAFLKTLIRELTEENEEKDETIAGLIGTIKDAYGFAVREMKARLDKNLLAVKDHTGKIVLVVLGSDIDQIAKEMLEEG